MMTSRLALALAAGTFLFTACGGAAQDFGAESTGSVELAIASLPADGTCLKVTVVGATRTERRSFDLAAASSPQLTIDRLPVGIAQIDASAFAGACTATTPMTTPTFVLEAPVSVRIDAAAIVRIVLKLVRNGRLDVSVDFEAPPWLTPGSAAFDLAIVGDTPYGAAQIADFPNLINALNADPDASQVVHVGDIKNGSTRCDDSHFQFIATQFARLTDPLVYTPGDNEWTDCHRANNGGYNPLERLARLRQLFYPLAGLMLGGGNRQALTQASFPGLEAFPENVLWMQGQVLFSTLHIVGSNDSALPWFADDSTKMMDDPAARDAERVARKAANLAWLERTFITAREQGAAAVLVAMQADTWIPGANRAAQAAAFGDYIRLLADLSRAFAKPVLLVQGDSHRYTVDVPLAAGDLVYGVMAPVPNLSRVVVEGETTKEYLKLHVDASTPAVFSWARRSLP